MRPHVVVIGEEPPEGFAFDGSVIFDDGSIHRRYGAGSECLYLIRPDGHVGFRSQPADGAALERYLDTLLG